MSDITKCWGTSASSYYTICPKREDCYRYKAPENEHWQSFAYFKFEGDSCPEFIPLKGGDG